MLFRSAVEHRRAECRETRSARVGMLHAAGEGAERLADVRTRHAVGAGLDPREIGNAERAYSREITLLEARRQRGDRRLQIVQAHLRFVREQRRGARQRRPKELEHVARDDAMRAYIALVKELKERDTAKV